MIEDTRQEDFTYTEKLEAEENELNEKVESAFKSLFSTGKAETKIGIETLSDMAEVFEENQHEINCDFSSFVKEQLRDLSF